MSQIFLTQTFHNFIPLLELMSRNRTTNHSRINTTLNLITNISILPPHLTLHIQKFFSITLLPVYQLGHELRMYRIIVNQLLTKSRNGQ